MRIEIILQIDSLLGLYSPARSSTQPTYSNVGPGRFSLTDWVSGDDEHCFANIHSARKKQASRPKVIFSASLFTSVLKGNLPLEDRYFFVAQLLRRADVYFWEARPDRLEERLIRRMDDFFEQIKLETIVPDSEKAIREQLSQAGHDPKGYIVVDNTAYVSLVAKLPACCVECVDDEGKKLETDKSSSPFVRYQIASFPHLTLKQNQESWVKAVRRLKTMPNVKSLNIPIIDSSDFPDDMLDEWSLDFLVFTVTTLPSTLPRIPDVLYVQAFRSLPEELPEYLAEIKTLTLFLNNPDNDTLSRLLSAMPALHTLRLFNCDNALFQNIPQMPQLKELFIIRPKSTEGLWRLNFSRFPSLKTVHISDPQSDIRWEIDFEHAPLTLNSFFLAGAQTGQGFFHRLSAAKGLRILYIRINIPSWEEFKSDLDKLEKLDTLALTGRALDLPNLRNLIYLDCDIINSSLTKIVNPLFFKHVPNLQYLILNVEVLGILSPDLPLQYLGLYKRGSNEITSVSIPSQILKRLRVLKLGKGLELSQLTESLPLSCHLITHTPDAPASLALPSTSFQNAQPEPAVALFNPEDYLATIQTDAMTGEQPVARYKDGLRFEVKQKGHSVPASELPLCYFDAIAEDGFRATSYRAAIPCTPTVLNESSLNKIALEGDSLYFLGKAKGRIMPGQHYPCPIPIDASWGTLFLCEESKNPERKLTFFYDENTHSYAFKLNSGEAAQEIAFTYLIKGNDLRADELTEPVTTDQPLLPDSFREKIEACINKTSKLKFMLDERLSLSQKVELLTCYCKGFQQKSAQHEAKHWLDVLLALAEQRAGVCRHRAQVGVLLLRFLGVPAVLVISRNHERVLVPYKTSTGKNYFQVVDLGGGENADLTDENLSKSLFDQAAGSSRVVRRVHEVAPTRNIQNSDEYQRYLELFKNRVERKPIDFSTLFTDTKPPILIHLPKGVKPSAAQADLLKYINQENKFEPSGARVIYIDHPADFQAWLTPRVLEGNRRVHKDGPLKHLIDGGRPGVIIVNWDNFTVGEAVSFASILDTKPVLGGIELPENIQVIGLIQSQPMCGAFESRCRHVDWRPPTLIQTPAPSAFSPESEKINLFHRHDWREVFVGDYVAEDGRLVFKEGPLLAAIHENRPIEIINPPDDEAFELFCHRLTHERKILLNGELIDFREKNHFQLSTQTQPQPLVLAADNIQLVPHAENKRKIYLSVNNFHACFKEMAYSEAHSCRGMLEAYDPEKDIFWITGFIPNDFWAVLVDEIQKKYAQKRFQFVLAPDAEIEHVAISSSSLQAERVQDDPTIFFSNDPELLVIELQEKYHATIIDVNPNTALGDALIKVEIHSESDLLSFKLTESDIYKKLKQGETIILNGTLSPTLYNALSAFLKPDGQFFWGGQWERLPGKLIMVMPKEAKENLLLNGESSIEVPPYEWADYEELIALEDRENFIKLRAFCDAASRWPHHGHTVEFTWQRIQKALDLLKNPTFHDANPIKEILLYDYPKDSETYAYLNVLAKYHFSNDRQTRRQKQKLERLIAEYGIHHGNIKPYFFRILNTLSFEEIQATLGSHLASQDQDLSVLNDAMIESLKGKIRSVLSMSAEERREISDELKTTAQYRALLENEKVSLIVLKGEKGSGKSFTVEQLKIIKSEPVTLYSIENIADWLEHASSNKPGYALLNLEEFNLYEDETWNVVKGLLRADKQVFYKGKLYSLTNKHKAIATGNPESYPNRYYHRLFQQAAHTIYFKKPDVEFLKARIFPQLIKCNLGDYQDFVYRSIIQACQWFDELVPWQACSFREYENICQRFNLFMEGLNTSNLEEIRSAVMRAIMSELSYGIANPEKQAEFLSHFPVQFSEMTEDRVFEIARDFALPMTRKPLYEMLIQDLQLRERTLEKQDERLPYKTGILIEGEPGLGKSRLYEEVLLQQGYSKESTDTRKKYYTINAGGPNNHEVVETLTRAAREGAIVILNELNLAPLETLLNQLLTGKFPDGSNVQKGFMVLASQNSTLEPGREAQSTALRSRFHMAFAQPYTTEELEALCEHAGIDNSTAFVQAYKETPHANTRTFFHCLEEVKRNRSLVRGC